MKHAQAAAAHLVYADQRRAQPLAFARLWHRDPPRTSQRDALGNPGKLVTIVLGGNRSGKSQGAAQVGVAKALGQQSHAARQWCLANNYPIPQLPKGRPGRVWAIALDSADSRRYVRPKYAQYLPEGTRWRNRDGPGEAEAHLPDGGVIVFKSVDQGRDGFQGEDIDHAHFDEEPRDEGVVNETLMRLADRKGSMLLSMTPLNGHTWLTDRWVTGEPDPDVRVHWLHGVDNPHMDPDTLETIYRQFGKHEQEARRYGKITALEGLVYPFERRLHVVPAFDPPKDWRRWHSMDFGVSNPACILSAALDPSDDYLHIYWEHHKAEWRVSQHAEVFKAHLAGEARRWHDAELEGDDPPWSELSDAQRRRLWPFRYLVADPEDKNARKTLHDEHGIRTKAANKAIRDGINAVAELLAPDAEGRPHLLIHDCCVQTIREFESYRWDTRPNSKRDNPDLPLKKNDHAMDALRYLCMDVKRSRKSIVVAAL